MVAALFVSVCLIGLICFVLLDERVRLPIGKDSIVRVQARFGVFVEAKVLRLWSEGAILYAEAVDEHGERFIRPVELLERV